MPSLALPNTPLFERAIKYAQSKPSTAIHDIRRSKDYTYSELVSAAAALRNTVLELRNARYKLPCNNIKNDIISSVFFSDLNEERIAFLCPK